MWPRKMCILCFALIFLAGCGGGHTLVLTAPSTQWSVSTVTVMSMPSSVDVPEEIRSVFESKLTTLLYDANTFHKGAELTLQYRFVQFAAGNQAVRWLVGPIGGAGEGSLTVEVRYVDGNEREIARIQSSGNVTAGAGGGAIDSAVDRAAEEIATFTKQHFH